MIVIPSNAAVTETGKIIMIRVSVDVQLRSAITDIFISLIVSNNVFREILLKKAAVTEIFRILPKFEIWLFKDLKCLINY